VTSPQEAAIRKSVTMIHTVASLVPTFNVLAAELLPGVDVFHVVDESLLTLTRREGSISTKSRRRLLGYATGADDLGVNAILVTCSSVGPVVDLMRPFLQAPVMRVDEAMVDEAITIGPRIGVLATLHSTLEPTRELLDAKGALANTKVDVRAVVADGAFDAIVARDNARHDQIVRSALSELAEDRDVVVLAQASMARVLIEPTYDRPQIPVLSSPRPAIERLASVLGVASGFKHGDDLLDLLGVQGSDRSPPQQES
jgi:Asp/Glu/hydantoin racemase